ncbi:MAG: alpha/beta hydrolase [Gammaproteobacteria bacterium]
MTHRNISSRSPLKRFAKNLFLIAVTAVITLWVVRAYNSRSMPDTAAWHEPALESEFRARDYPDGIAFQEYLQLERKLAAELDQFTRTRIAAVEAQRAIRYIPGSPMNSNEHETNWNWSFVMPHKAAVGTAVLIHGASDSPYSMRAVAERLNHNGLNAIVIRSPGHGTLPGELTRARVADWQAIVRSAITEAQKMNAPNQPIYLVGYSMGGALAVNYTLESLTDESLVRPDGIVLISPAIAISRFAAFANLDLMFSRMPGFKKFAWTSINPEYDPYKYNSFPKQTGRQTYILTKANLNMIERLRHTESWSELPPIITFMSAVDATVSVRAVVDNLYRPIRSDGSALVLFGVNQTNQTLGFLKQDYLGSVNAVINDSERSFDLTVVGNKNGKSQEVIATTYCAKDKCLSVEELALSWPESIFSLSHVALPFSPADPVYGSASSDDSPGTFTLGSLQPRGERGILVVSTDNLMRLRYNPFIDYLLDRTSEFCELESSAE